LTISKNSHKAYQCSPTRPACNVKKLSFFRSMQPSTLMFKKIVMFRKIVVRPILAIAALVGISTLALAQNIGRGWLTRYAGYATERHDSGDASWFRDEWRSRGRRNGRRCRWRRREGRPGGGSGLPDDKSFITSLRTMQSRPSGENDSTHSRLRACGSSRWRLNPGKT
jgi:hypothetical protein